MDERNIKNNLYDFNMVLQCTNIEFYSRIEELFEQGMTWENYGNKPNEWTVEYIIPLSFYELYKNMFVFQTNERILPITIQDMCTCVNIRPVWNSATKEKKQLSYDAVIEKCYEILQFKNRAKQMKKCYSCPNFN